MPCGSQLVVTLGKPNPAAFIGQWRLTPTRLHQDLDQHMHSTSYYALVLNTAGQERGPHGPSRFSHQAHPSRRFQKPCLPQGSPSPNQLDTQSGAQVTPPARGHSQNEGEVQSSSKRQGNPAEPTSERRAAVDREVARLELEGAPSGTRYYCLAQY